MNSPVSWSFTGLHASRAALLTGCYLKRVGMPAVLFLLPPGTQPQGAHHSRSPEARVMPPLVSASGTSVSQASLAYFQQVRHCGIPYSNDMNHPDKAKSGWAGMDILWDDPEYPHQMENTLVEDEKIVELHRCTPSFGCQKSIDHQGQQRQAFLRRPPIRTAHSSRSHEIRDPIEERLRNTSNTSMPRSIVFSKRWMNSSSPYLVIYHSDNGPWLQFLHRRFGGAPREEGTTFEGSSESQVMRGPGIPAGSVCDELTGTIDLLPTIAALTGKPLPSKNKIDGVDASGLWKGTAKKSPRKEFLHYTSRGDIEGIRSGNWKLLVKKPRRNNAGKAQLHLFDLAKGVGEKTPRRRQTFSGQGTAGPHEGARR